MKARVASRHIQWGYLREKNVSEECESYPHVPPLFHITAHSRFLHPSSIEPRKLPFNALPSITNRPRISLFSLTSPAFT